MAKKKVDKTMSDTYKINSEMNDEDKAFLVTSLDTGVINVEIAKKIVDNGDVDVGVDTVEYILSTVAEITGNGRNFLGYSDDISIYGKVDDVFKSFTIFNDSELTNIGGKLVQNDITTGYGIKSKYYNANFLKDLTLQYGHSDILHAHQLIGLLNSENIIVKVQLEPKVSVYQYLLEWGEIPPATPTYEVKKYGNLYLTHALEYDLKLEFSNKEDMLKFDTIVKDYAKKNADDENTDGLIYDSWWQPFYSTTNIEMPQENYKEIYDVVIGDDLQIHTFTLPQDKDKVIENVKKINNKIAVDSVKRYCNNAFYSYMTGEDYQ